MINIGPNTKHQGVKSFETVRINTEGKTLILDQLSVEEPLEIQLAANGKDLSASFPLSVTMRTPGHDHELAVGFLFTEGIIKQKDDLLAIGEVKENVILIKLNPAVKIDQQSMTRNFYTTSSCGVCGKASIEAISVNSMVNQNNFSVKSSILNLLPSKIITAQEIFQSTGGLHASALFDAEGNLLMIREDVGRHNALDKVIGATLLSYTINLGESILLVSGRASFELVQKAAVAGIPVVAAIGAPSSLAVELAEAKGIALLGFLKSDRFNIYSHPNRIR
jgi:FdhD protein